MLEFIRRHSHKSIPADIQKNQDAPKASARKTQGLERFEGGILISCALVLPAKEQADVMQTPGQTTIGKGGLHDQSTA
jgi:hypothetical protein